MAKPNLVAQEDFEMNNRMIEKLFERVNERVEELEDVTDCLDGFDPQDADTRCEKLEDQAEDFDNAIDELENEVNELGDDVKALQRDGHRIGAIVADHSVDIAQFRNLARRGFFGRLRWLLTGRL